MFITLHINTLHTEDPEGLIIHFASVCCLNTILNLSCLFGSHFQEPIFIGLLKMKEWGAESHHYTPQIPSCVTIWPVKHNNGYLLREQNPHKQATLEMYLNTQFL